MQFVGCLIVYFFIYYGVLSHKGEARVYLSLGQSAHKHLKKFI